MWTTFAFDFFSNIEVYIYNQQVYKSNGLHAHKSYNSNNFKRTISEYKEVLVCKGYDYEECLDENGIVSVWTFFHEENENF